MSATQVLPDSPADNLTPEQWRGVWLAKLDRPMARRDAALAERTCCRAMPAPRLEQLLSAPASAQSPNSYLFPGADPARDLTVRSAQKVLRQACQRAGVSRKGSLRTLRHCLSRYLRDSAQAFTTHMSNKTPTLDTSRACSDTPAARPRKSHAHVSTSAVSAIPSPLGRLSLTRGQARTAQRKGEGA